MTKDELKEYILKTYDGQLAPLETGVFDPMFEVKADDLTEVALKLRDDDTVRFDFLNNIAGVDTTERFEIVYSLSSVTKTLRLDFRVVLPYDQAVVDSVRTIWPAADWHEREIWELFGIDFNNHDNLKRFLLPDDWDQGYPMRKDWDAPDFVRMPEL